MRNIILSFHPPHLSWIQSLFLVLLIVVFSCTTEKKENIPANVYPPDSMVLILADIHLVEAQLTQIGYRPNATAFRSAFMQDMMQKNNIDTSRFNTSFEFYTSKPELFAAMYDDVIVEIRQQQAGSGIGSK